MPVSEDPQEQNSSPQVYCRTTTAGRSGETRRKEVIMASNQKQSGQGRVKDPQKDQRLKDNQGGSQGQGQVKDPKNDGRLKENRDK
jgi:hypothetical protein